MDVTTLITAITAGAAVLDKEFVRDETKDAYLALKTAIVVAMGRRAERVIEKIEATPGDAAVRPELVALFRSVPTEDALEIERNVLMLLSAIKLDPAAKPVLEFVAPGQADDVI